jgi:UDPglucose 6-dehydrogenase
MFPDFRYVGSAYEACEGAHAAVLLTEWNQYRALDLPRIHSSMEDPLFIDLRNVYEPERMREAGFRYVGVGRS